MVEIHRSSVFKKWFDGLRDERAKGKIEVRIRRLSMGNPGDCRPVGEGISEMRIDYGPGYRVYYKQFGEILAVLLCGGDKSTQEADIVNAKKIVKEY